MKKVAGFCALAVLLLASGPALADGYSRRVPAPIPVPAPVPIPETFTYYLRGDLGWSFSATPSLLRERGNLWCAARRAPRQPQRRAPTMGVLWRHRGGAYLSSHFRADLTLDFRGEQSVDATATYTDVGPIRNGARQRQAARHRRPRQHLLGLAAARSLHALRRRRRRLRLQRHRARATRRLRPASTSPARASDNHYGWRAR